MRTVRLDSIRTGTLRASRWLRHNSEHYLLLDAQTRMAAVYGRPGPPPPRGASEIFWRKVFTPTYRHLPWKVRSTMIQRIPGSHRRDWSSSVTSTRGPAV